VAFLPHDKQVRLLAKAKLERRTPLTITDRKQLLVILERVAKDGYAIETDETDIGVTCIAAPILFPAIPAHGEALSLNPVASAAGSISVSVPTARATGDDLDRLLKLVQRAALASGAGMAKALKSVDR
jgi:DNA-binding IclR family transcriptional regulator